MGKKEEIIANNLKAYTGNSKYVFIGYAHSDEAEVIEQLRKNGFVLGIAFFE